MPWGPGVQTQLVIPSDAGPNDPQIDDVGAEDVPPELVAYYAAHGGLTVIAARLYRQDANDYTYTALLSNGTRADGVVTGGVVVEGQVLAATGGAAVTFIRGQLRIGSGPFIQISPGAALPAKLIAFYSPDTIVGGEVYFQFPAGGDDFVYDVFIVPNVGLPYRAFGAINSVSDVIAECLRYRTSGTTSRAEMAGLWHLDTQGTLFQDPGSKFDMQGFTSINGPTGAGAIVNGGNNDLWIDGNVQGRGLLARIDNSGTVYTSTGTGITDTGFTIAPKVKNGRAAMLVFRGQAVSTIDQCMSLRVRYKTLAGTDVGFLGTIRSSAQVGATVPFVCTLFVRNVSGADITNNFVIAGNLLSGTTAFSIQSGPAIGRNEVSADWYDVNDASAYPLAFSMTP